MVLILDHGADCKRFGSFAWEVSEAPYLPVSGRAEQQLPESPRERAVFTAEACLEQLQTGEAGLKLVWGVMNEERDFKKSAGEMQDCISQHWGGQVRTAKGLR